jgi:hypothetical protein
MFQIPGYPLFQTTVGKLNFFRWAIERGVLQYIKDNLKTIESAMNASAREIAGLIALRAGRRDEARQAFQALAADVTAPRGVRERAQRLAMGLEG